ncbi:MAG: phage holin family protein, partial [Caldilineaceae bacterium]|nr:phage holin family protein [Caldilineaceae bacterium]
VRYEDIAPWYEKVETFVVTFVVNALMLLLTGWLAGLFNVDFRVDGFGAAFLGALVISFVSFLLSLFISAEKDDKD